MSLNGKCIRQKQITFTPRQFHLEGIGFKSKMKKKQRESKNLENFYEAWVESSLSIYSRTRCSQD